MSLTVPTISNHYSLRVPAHRFRQGGRDVYSFSLDLGTLDGLLPQRVDEDVVKDANRRLTPNHARNIQMYLQEENSKWVLGSLLLGIAPDALEFLPYADESGQANDRVGELRIISDRKSTMRIFDGQHRRRAIAEAIAAPAEGQEEPKWRAELLESSVPIVLYAEANITALRQMFADASKTKTIEANTVTRFDERDAFNLAAVWLTENSDLFGGRVEMERTTVSRGSQNLVAINQLAATLKTMDVGYKGRVSKDRNDCYIQNVEELRERCLTWADGFMLAAREEYNSLVAGDIDNSEIPSLRAKTFAYNSTFIRMMAGCYHEWVKYGSSWESLANYFSSVSLERGIGSKNLLAESGVIAIGDTVLASKPIVTKAVDYIVSAAHEAIK